MTSAIPVQCSTNWAIKPSGNWSLCKFVIYPWKVKDTSEIWNIMHIFEMRRKIWRQGWSHELKLSNGEIKVKYTPTLCSPKNRLLQWNSYLFPMPASQVGTNNGKEMLISHFQVACCLCQNESLCEIIHMRVSPLQVHFLANQIHFHMSHKVLRKFPFEFTDE